MQKNVYAVKRRYKDFLYLHNKINEKFKGLSLPKLPDKKFVNNTSLDFVEKRKEVYVLIAPLALY